MANNKVSSLFNKEMPTPPRSNFNLGRVNRFTADVGYVIPCYVEEVLPNSYKRLDVESLIQTNATVAPLMGSFKVKFEAFFVPLRLYHRHLDLNNVNLDFDDDFDFHYFKTPVKSDESAIGFCYDTSNLALGTSFGVAPSSLLDYLGIMPVGFSSRSFADSFKLNATPFIAYFDIYRNYYSNPHDKFVPYRVQNAPINGDFTPGSDTPYFEGPDVKYIQIDMLDKFITSINTDSISTFQSSLTNSGSSIQPNAVDVFRYFNRYVGDYVSRNYAVSGTLSNDELYLTSVPLFQHQRNAMLSSSGSTTAPTHWANTSNGLHFGLLPRTYMDDYFNSRFLNEFVEYMEEQAVINVENNQFSVQQLRLANRIAKYVDKSIFSDTRFGSWIKAHFGVKTNSKLNIPQFLGSISSNITFNDIYASAQTAGDASSVTDNTALGSRASLGQGYVKNKGSFIEFKATEPGYIMVMFSIVPYVSYFQGIKKMYLKNNFSDIYKPEFDAQGYQDLEKVELDANPFAAPTGLTDSTNVGPNFADYNVSIGKHPSWIEYMTSFDESHGLMTQRFQYGYWTLNRPFNPRSYDETLFNITYKETPAELADANIISVASLNLKTGNLYPETISNIQDTSTYINSDYFNTIFAVNKYFDNFQVQVRFFDKTKQPMSKQILPHL